MFSSLTMTNITFNYWCLLKCTQCMYRLFIVRKLRPSVMHELWPRCKCAWCNFPTVRRHLTTVPWTQPLYSNLTVSAKFAEAELCHRWYSILQARQWLYPEPTSPCSLCLMLLFLATKLRCVCKNLLSYQNVWWWLDNSRYWHSRQLSSYRGKITLCALRTRSKFVHHRRSKFTYNKQSYTCIVYTLVNISNYK